MDEMIIENINTPKMLGIALKRLRTKAGMNQTELANLIGIRQGTISDLENGSGTLETLFKVVQALKVNMVCSNQSLEINKGNKSKTQNVIDLLGL